MSTQTNDLREDTVSQRITIVLADDHAVVRKGIRDFLEEEPSFEVVAEARDGAEAWALIMQHHPDVAVLDIRMPEMSGVELTRRIKAEFPEIKVLILTAHDDDLFVMALVRAGADGYLLKTAESRELLVAVKRVYSGSIYLDAGVTPAVVASLSQSPQEVRLSEREREVVAGVAQGWTNREIARQLGISDRTVQCHLANIFVKLHVSSRTGVTTVALERGIISLVNVGETVATPKALRVVA